MHNQDPYHLSRFAEAQQNIYQRVISELKSGRKKSHWIWFIFPQIDGLGFSHTAKKYAIQSLEEAHAYLNHDLLGRHLIECTRLTLDIKNRSATEIFGYPDDLKFRSSMTLFSLVSEQGSAFHQALKVFFNEVPDIKTLEILNIHTE